MALYLRIKNNRLNLLICCLQVWYLHAAGQPELSFREQPGVSLQFIIPDDTTAIMKMIKAGEDLMTDRPDSALRLLNRALEKSRESGYTYGTALALCDLGKIYTVDNRYNQAREAFLGSLAHAVRSEKGKSLLPFIYGNISWMYALQGKYEPAAQYLFHLASFAEQYSRPAQRSVIYSNIGGILGSLPEPYQSASRKQALYYCDKAEQNARLANDSDMLATVLLNKGDLYVREKNWEQSRFYLDAARNLSRKLGLDETHHNVLVTFGEMYLARQMPAKALPYLLEARRITGNINPYYRLPEMINLGRAYYMLKQYDQAKDLLREAKSLSGRFRLLHPEIEAILADIYTDTEHYAQALLHYRKYVQERDSLISRQHTGNIHNLETKYRTAQKDKELAEQQLQIGMQQQQLKQKNIWISVAMIGTLVLMVLLAALYRNYRQRQQFQRERIRNLQQQQHILHKEQEIERLKAMMTGEEKERTRVAQELHDGIGGMLAAINMHFNVAQKTYRHFNTMPELNQIMQMVEETTEEVRKTAHNLLPGILLTQDIAEALRVYCDQVTIDNGLHIDLHLPEPSGALDKSVELIIFRIIQELIQNMIKHAQATHAIIEMEQRDDQLIITVEDNGIGFDQKRHRNGFGLQNLQFRVNALQGTFRIESEESSGTTIHIKFDIQKLNQQPGTR